jgi:hypothetical protein
MIERRQLLASIPPDQSAELEQSKRQQEVLERDARELHQGTGRWAGTAAGQAARDLTQAALEHQVASTAAGDQDRGRWARRQARRQLRDADTRFDRAMGVWERDGQPYARQLEARRGQLSAHVGVLEKAQQDRSAYLGANPEVPRRVAELDHGRRHAPRRAVDVLAEGARNGHAAGTTTPRPTYYRGKRAGRT